MFPHVRLISFGFGKKGKPLGLRHDQVGDARGIYDPAHECPHGLGFQPAIREYSAEGWRQLVEGTAEHRVVSDDEGAHANGPGRCRGKEHLQQILLNTTIPHNNHSHRRHPPQSPTTVTNGVRANPIGFANRGSIASCESL